MGGLGWEVLLLRFCSWCCPLLLPIPAGVGEGLPLQQICPGCAFSWPGPFPDPHKARGICRLPDARVQWEILSSPQDSGSLWSALTSTRVLWIFLSVWVKCCTLPLHSCLWKSPHVVGLDMYPCFGKEAEAKGKVSQVLRWFPCQEGSSQLRES